MSVVQEIIKLQNIDSQLQDIAELLGDLPIKVESLKDEESSLITSLENGKFQRGEINVVIFRSLEVNNFVLNNAEGGRTIKNILDVPKA